MLPMDCKKELISRFPKWHGIEFKYDYITEYKNENNENEYILCIKSYMNNEEILEYIKNNTPFKNITTLYINESSASDEYVGNNLYLVSK